MSNKTKLLSETPFSPGWFHCACAHITTHTQMRLDGPHCSCINVSAVSAPVAPSLISTSSVHGPDPTPVILGHDPGQGRKRPWIKSPIHEALKCSAGAGERKGSTHTCITVGPLASSKKLGFFGSNSYTPPMGTVQKNL